MSKLHEYSKVKICKLIQNPYDFKSMPDWYAFTGFVLLPNLILLFIALLMWTNPYRFLRHISDDETLSADNLDVNDFGSILIAIVGLYVVTFSFADLVYHYTSIKIAKDFLKSDFRYTPDQTGQIIATIVELILGFVLIYGRNILLLFIQQFRKEIKSINK